MCKLLFSYHMGYNRDLQDTIKHELLKLDVGTVLRCLLRNYMCLLIYINSQRGSEMESGRERSSRPTAINQSIKKRAKQPDKDWLKPIHIDHIDHIVHVVVQLHSKSKLSENNA